MIKEIIKVFHQANLFFVDFFYSNDTEAVLNNRLNDLIINFSYVVRYKYEINNNNQQTIINLINNDINFIPYTSNSKIIPIDIIFGYINDVINFYKQPSDYISLENIYAKKITVCIKIFGLKKLYYNCANCYLNINDKDINGFWSKITHIYRILFKETKIRQIFFKGKKTVFYETSIVNYIGLTDYFNKLIDFCLDYEKKINPHLTDVQIYKIFVNKYSIQ